MISKKKNWDSRSLPCKLSFAKLKLQTSIRSTTTATLLCCKASPHVKFTQKLNLRHWQRHSCLQLFFQMTPSEMSSLKNFWGSASRYSNLLLLPQYFTSNSIYIEFLKFILITFCSLPLLKGSLLIGEGRLFTYSENGRTRGKGFKGEWL